MSTERLPKTYPFQQAEGRKGNDELYYPPPSAVVAAALSEIQPDGTVMIYHELNEEHPEEEPGEWVSYRPYPPVDFAYISDESFGAGLLELARIIHGIIHTVALTPENTEYEVRRLGHILTAYEHEPQFIELATSLVRLDEEQNVLYYPNHPYPGNPRQWAHDARVQLLQTSGSHVKGKT